MLGLRLPSLYFRAFIAVSAVVALLHSTTLKAESETIEFPEEELAQESVLPKFVPPSTLKTRNVVTNGKFEIGPYFGVNASEPIYNQSKIGLNLSYHWSEYDVLTLNIAHWTGGKNSFYTDGIETKSSTDQNARIDFGRIPKIQNSYFLQYELNTFYGKISFTKQGVLNTAIYPMIGVGMTSYEHKSYFGGWGGIGQKLFLTKWLSIRADFKFMFSQAPNPFLKTKLKKNETAPAPSDFGDKSDFNTILEAGLSFMF